MTKRYTGGVVSSAVPTVNAATASGVFLLSQQADAAAKNNWPPFKVEKSVRLRNSNTGYFYKTPAVAGNKTTWTYSCWVKRGSIQSYNSGAYQSFLGFPSDGTNEDICGFGALNDDVCYFYVYSGGYTGRLITSQVFRDVSAWYHLTFVWDTTNATSGDRMRLYVNGTRVTAFSTASYPNQNAVSNINTAAQQNIGRYNTSTGVDAYLAEVNFIDGQALTPSSFGGTDKDGNWSPIAYTGTYGQNGFYLNFKDATSTTTIGYDYSGNGNHWTSSGISVTAGATYDSMIDVPVDQSDGTANNRGNYCTLNPVSALNSSTTADGNLKGTLPAATALTDIYGTMASGTTGKFYWETTYVSRSGNSALTTGGVRSDVFGAEASGTDGFGYYSVGGQVFVNGSTVATYATYTTTDVIGIALDLTNSQVSFYKQTSGTGSFVLQGTVSIASGYSWIPGYSNGTTSGNQVVTVNFGQRPFNNSSPPSGFKTLNTFNLPEPTIKQPNKHFDATLITGTAATQVITNAGGFQPDFVWLKSRTNANNPTIYDAIRGVNTILYPALTNAEAVGSAQLTAFSSNGFTLGASENANDQNAEASVGWQWKANGASVSNTSGSITSTVSVNQAAGFSIVTYTSPNNAGDQTVGHGLFVKPSMIIVKNRDNTYNWDIYHSSLGYNSSLIFTTAATRSGAFGAEPTSTLFTTKTTYTHNSTNKYVAYCFAPIAGYSAFGSYTGNGSTDGPFVYTGFRPRFLLTKRSDAIESWRIGDSSRSPYNAVQLELFANLSNAEENNSNEIDYLSNGFKIRTSSSSHNASGGTYIYMAFAEMPFKYSRSR
jgi:hypothetical protein